MKKTYVIFIGISLILLSGVSVFAFSDDFNRSDSTNLGPNWTQQVGSIGISGNQASSSAGGDNYATVNGFSGNYLSTKITMDVFDQNTGLAYDALVFGIAGTSQSIFVKVQDQGGSGNFNYYAFYYGNNGGGAFTSLNTPFQSGRLTVWASDLDTIWLGIDSNFDGTYEQTYSNTGWSSKTLGTGIGLGMYGNVRADNYTTEGGSQRVPEPGTLLLFASGLMGLLGLRKCKN
jgi:hypothetical protein